MTAIPKPSLIPPVRPSAERMDVEIVTIADLLRDGARAIGMAWAARHRLGHGCDELIG